MRKEDIPKSVKITPFASFEFNYITFGLRNAAQTIQRHMDQIFSDLDLCFGYIDDILIGSSSIDEHLLHLDVVLRRILEHNLTINLTKCIFPAEKVKFLGHIIDKSGIELLSDKVQDIQIFQKRTNFVGF